MEKPIVKIENWSLVTTDHDPWQSPEMAIKRLCGEVYSHPRIADSQRVTTTRIIHCIDEHTVETRNTVYQLGTPAEEYVEWCKKNNVFIPSKECPLKINDD